MKPEQDAFLEEHFRAQFNRLKYRAYCYLGDYAQAEVAVQEAFVTACTKIDAFMGSPNPTGWIVETVKNVSLNMQRSQNLYQSLFISVEALEQPLEVELENDDAPLDIDGSCQESLTPNEYQLFRRYAVNRESTTKLAEEFGISAPACRKRLQRTAEKMRVILTEEGKHPKKNFFAPDVHNPASEHINIIEGRNLNGCTQ